MTRVALRIPDKKTKHVTKYRFKSQILRMKAPERESRMTERKRTLHNPSANKHVSYSPPN